MTHGRGQQGGRGLTVGVGGRLGRGEQWGNWDNHNRTTRKMFLNFFKYYISKLMGHSERNIYSNIHN